MDIDDYFSVIYSVHGADDETTPLGEAVAAVRAKVERMQSDNKHLRYALKMTYAALDALGDEPNHDVSPEAWQRTRAESAVMTARNVLRLTGDYPAG